MSQTPLALHTFGMRGRLWYPMDTIKDCAPSFQIPGSATALSTAYDLLLVICCQQIPQKQQTVCGWVFAVRANHTTAYVTCQISLLSAVGSARKVTGPHKAVVYNSTKILAGSHWSPRLLGDLSVEQTVRLTNSGTGSNSLV